MKKGVFLDRKRHRLFKKGRKFNPKSQILLSIDFGFNSFSFGPGGMDNKALDTFEFKLKNSVQNYIRFAWLNEKFQNKSDDFYRIVYNRLFLKPELLTANYKRLENLLFEARQNNIPNECQFIRKKFSESLQRVHATHPATSSLGQSTRPLSGFYEKTEDLATIKSIIAHSESPEVFNKSPLATLGSF